MRPKAEALGYRFVLDRQFGHEMTAQEAKDLRTCLVTVLPDEPTTRGAATSLRAEAFGWALPVGRERNLVADQRKAHAKL
jgi:hypothetical protein